MFFNPAYFFLGLRKGEEAMRRLRAQRKPVNFKSTNMEKQFEQTFGEKMVRVNFNASGSDEVNELKKDFAAIIDKVNAIRDKAGVTDKDAARQASVAITHLETAAMYAVKAVTG